MCVARVPWHAALTRAGCWHVQEKGYTDYPFLSEVAPEKAEQLAALV